MNDDISTRLTRIGGTPHDAGFQLGRTVRGTMERNIERYLEGVTVRYGAPDTDRLATWGRTWYQELPQRFREELEGFAVGAEIPLERLIAFYSLDSMLADNCSGLICMINGKAWIARNNDWLVPELWGYATINEISGRIPTLTFGMQGGIFSVTGINREKLWLHHHYLPARDRPSVEKPCLDYFVWVTEALETCSSTADITNMLESVDRSGGMMLFAVDGKTNQYAIYECSCSRFRVRYHARYLTGTNHSLSGLLKREKNTSYRNSTGRLERLTTLVNGMLNGDRPPEVPEGFLRVMGDEGVEQRGDPYTTVYSAVACPSEGSIWFTFGGYPAASHGNWQQIDWPWE